MTFLDSQHYSYNRTLSPTAALLLDVENFALKLDLEEYLKAHCIYPITIKFAVGNWRNSAIANLDLYLHQRKYQLIHVPKEKNGADAQILTLGTSLLFQYPHIAEIIIVSHDSIFDYLHQSLQSLGCKTYKVYQQSNNLYIHNSSDNRTHTISIPNNKTRQGNSNNKANNKQEKDPSLILQNKIKLILNKLESNSTTPITIQMLSQEYKKECKRSLSDVIKTNKLGGSVIKFLKNNCRNKIDIDRQKNNYYISIKQNK